MDNKKNLGENEQDSTVMFDAGKMSVDDLLSDYGTGADGGDYTEETLAEDDARNYDEGYDEGYEEQPDDIDDEQDPPPAWETRTVAVAPQQSAPEQEPDDDGEEADEQPEEPEEDHMTMPNIRRRVFRRVPKRVYHRGRLFSLIYVAATVLICVFISVMFLRVFNDVLAFSTGNAAVTIEIEEDDTADTVAKKLMDAGLIKYNWLFSYVAKFEGQTGPYETGEHTLTDDMNYMQLLDAIDIKATARETVWVTFTEGMTLNEIAAELEEKNVCDAEEFKNASKNNGDYGYDFEKSS